MPVTTVEAGSSQPMLSPPPNLEWARMVMEDEEYEDYCRWILGGTLYDEHGSDFKLQSIENCTSRLHLARMKKRAASTVECEKSGPGEGSSHAAETAATITNPDSTVPPWIKPTPINTTTITSPKRTTVSIHPNHEYNIDTSIESFQRAVRAFEPYHFNPTSTTRSPDRAVLSTGPRQKNTIPTSTAVERAVLSIGPCHINAVSIPIQAAAADPQKGELKGHLVIQRTHVLPASIDWKQDTILLLLTGERTSFVFNVGATLSSDHWPNGFRKG